MKTRIHFVLATCALMLFAVGDTYGQTAADSTCYATSGGGTGQLMTIDLGSGAGTVIGTGTGTDGLPGLAIDSKGNIFATDRFSQGLFRLDASTGLADRVATMPADLGGIAFDSNNVLFGISPYGDFVTVDTATGAWDTLRVDPAMSAYVGLAFDSEGILYGSIGNASVSGAVVDIDGIGIIDPADGSETLVGYTGLGGGTPDIAFDFAGNFYGTKGGGGGTSSLISIDPGNGVALGTIGSVVEHASGLACHGDTEVDGPAPEPEGKVYVCHVAGKSGKTKTLHIDATSLQDHLAHGDTAGECQVDDVADEGKGKGKGKKNGKFDASSSVPDSYGLSQNYPNPFNPTTTISFALPEAASVRLAVYNAVGQEVKVLVSSTLEAGTHAATWNATDRTGQRLATGMYIYRLTAGSHVETRKMLLLE